MPRKSFEDNLPVEGPLTYAEHTYERLMPPGFTLTWTERPASWTGADLPSDPLYVPWMWDSWDYNTTGCAAGSLEYIVTSAWVAFARLPREKQIELSNRFPEATCGIFY